jgi:hypothetical protein
MEHLDLDIIIKQLKVQFGEVHMAEVEDDIYIFRLLTRQEYKEVHMVSDNKDQAEEIICQLAVVYPQGLNFAKGDAGLPSLLAPWIVNESGFGDMAKTHYYFDSYRARMESFEMQAEAAIQAAFPHITEEEMQEWTVEKLMRTLAKAEWILKNVKGYALSFERITLEEGEGEEEQQEEPPTMKEIGLDMRRQGRDPMVELADIIIKPREFAEFPFIAGTEYWKKVF